MSERPLIPGHELKSFLDSIAAHTIEPTADTDPQEIYAGNVVYRASNGWTVVVFNDANEYDYIDSVVAADGREIDFDQIELTDLEWVPDDALAWKCFGIPGYCIFRCTACGGQIPDGAQRRRRMAPPFLCGDDRCVGLRENMLAA